MVYCIELDTFVHIRQSYFQCSVTHDHVHLYINMANHQPPDCLLNRFFQGAGKKKTSNLRVTGLCEGNSPVTDEFPAQRAINAENVSIWLRHHDWLSWLYVSFSMNVFNVLWQVNIETRWAMQIQFCILWNKTRTYSFIHNRELL